MVDQTFLLDTLQVNNESFTFDTPSNCTIMKCFIEPLVLFSGLISNIVLILIIHKKKYTKSLSSSKPLGYLLIGMLVSDVWFLIQQINVWYFTLMNRSDLTSYNGFCQLYTYFEYFFSFSLEFYMLFANYILLSIIFKSKKWTTHSNEDVYNQFLIPTDESEPRKSSLLTRNFRDSVRALYRKFHLVNKNTDLTQQINEKGDYETMADSLKAVAGSGTASKNTNKLISSQSPSASSSTNNRPLASLKISNKKNNKNSLIKRQRSKFLILFDTVKFKNEQIYFNILIKEKVAIILCVFICLYLLSFLLWIRGIRNLNDHEEKYTYSDKAIFPKLFASTKQSFDSKIIINSSEYVIFIVYFNSFDYKLRLGILKFTECLKELKIFFITCPYNRNVSDTN
jgi:hypothetical protein